MTLKNGVNVFTNHDRKIRNQLTLNNLEDYETVLVLSRGEVEAIMACMEVGVGDQSSEEWYEEGNDLAGIGVELLDEMQAIFKED